MFEIVQKNGESNGSGVSLLEEIGRQMLTSALAVEVAAYLDQFSDLVAKNGRQ